MARGLATSRRSVALCLVSIKIRMNNRVSK
jgi:hypothetical protein